MLYSFFHPARLMVYLCAAGMSLLATPLAAAPSLEAMLIRVEEGRLVVGRVERFPLWLPHGQRGLFIWADGRLERWQVVSWRWQPPRLPREGRKVDEQFSRGGMERSPMAMSACSPLSSNKPCAVLLHSTTTPLRWCRMGSCCSSDSPGRSHANRPGQACWPWVASPMLASQALPRNGPCAARWARQ
jgi:hypothetical protein